jgi:hypothetical protein
MKRRFTLHDQDLPDDTAEQHEDAEEETPLLPSEGRVFHNQTWLGQAQSWVKTNAANTWDFLTSPIGIGIFKYSLAYLLASMGTFVPFLRELFGRSDTKHTVATVTVYFHPSRSQGSMFEAMIYAFTAFAYTTVVSVISMGIGVLFEDKIHLLSLGHAIILVLFIGGGLGFIAWVKLRYGDPLINVACSLASLTLITILTKEGSVQEGDFSLEKVSQILRMVIGGVIASVLVCFIVFPTSARRKLKQNMVDATDCLSDMLAMITSSFISGDESELEGPVLVKVTERHRKSLDTLTQNLKESRYEHYVLGTEKRSWYEQRLATCIQRLSQSIGGLRSTASTQFVVVQQPFPSYSGMHRRLGSWTSIPTTPYSQTSQRQHMSQINEILESHAMTASPDVDRHGQLFRTPSQIFDLFMDHLGPSMRSLAYTLKEILDDLPFDPEQNYAITVNPKFKVSLQRATELYKAARAEALHAVYEKSMDRKRPMEVQADWEEAAACCGHFSTSLIDVADDVQDYLIILDEMEDELGENRSSRSWSWLKVWRKDPEHQVVKENPLLAQPDEVSMHLRTHENTVMANVNETSWKQLKRRCFRKIYERVSFTRRDDVKYATKVGFGAVLYALPSFLKSTRPIYQHWRGEWGLLSYMLVCSMTIGASNTTGYSRIYGTCLGAIMAIIAWSISDGDPIALAVFGFGMTYWTGYITIAKGKGPMGRFIMLTYNLSALYAYSLSVSDEEDDGDEEDPSNNPLIWPIVGHRVTSVIVGCLWGLVITRAVWPISARQKLKEGLSLIWLRMGLIWKRDPLSILVEGESPHSYMNLAEEFKLQQFVRKLSGMVESAKSEFELRGPFPHPIYRKIVDSTTKMLDVFHEMNIVIPKGTAPSPGLEAVLAATKAEREQLCSRISHLFSVLASSMKLEFPLATDALPNIDHTRDRLLARIFAYRQADIDSKETSDEDFSVIFSYALATGQLAQEIHNVLKEVENLFGVLDEEALRLQ